MKKFLSLLLALTLVLSLVVVPARAADNYTIGGTTPTIKVEAGGTSVSTVEKNTELTYTLSVDGLTVSKSTDGGTANVVDSKNYSLDYTWTGATKQSDEKIAKVTPDSAKTLSVTCKIDVKVGGNTVVSTTVNASDVTVTDCTDGVASITCNGVTSDVSSKQANYYTVTTGQPTDASAFTPNPKSGYVIKGDHTYNSSAKTLTVPIVPTGSASSVQAKNTEISLTEKVVSLSGVTVTASPKYYTGQNITFTANGTNVPTGAQYVWTYIKDGGNSQSLTSTSTNTLTTKAFTTAGSYVVSCKVKFGTQETATATASAITVEADAYTPAFNGTATPSDIVVYNSSNQKTTQLPTPYLKSAKVGVADVLFASLTNVTYKSSSDSIATVNNSGLVTAGSTAGTATITVSFSYQNKDYSKTYTIYNRAPSYTIPTSIQAGAATPYDAATLRLYASHALASAGITGSAASITGISYVAAKSNCTVTQPSYGSTTYYVTGATFGTATFTGTVSTYSNGTYPITFTVAVKPQATTYEDQYPEPVAYGNTYRYYVQVPSGFTSYYVLGTPNQTTEPNWTLTGTQYYGNNLQYYGNNLYYLTDSNFVGGKCTLWLVTRTANGAYYCGQLTVYQKNYNINYNGVAGETVQFKHTDFTNFMNEVAQARGDSSKTGSYPYVTFSYVTFDYPSTAQGTLYYNGTAMSTSSYSGAFNSRTQITNLDNITFVPYAKTNAKTVAVTFTLHAVKYGTNGTVVNRDVQYRGTVNISLVREDVTFTVAPGDSVTFTDSAFLNYLRAQSGINYNYNIDYVTFDQSAVDTINGGVLYSGYAGFNAVKPTDRFYYTTTNNYTQNALSDVTFRASTYAKTGTTVYIPFTIYARYGTTGTGTRQVTGTVAVKIAQTMNFVDVKPTDYFYNPVKWAVGKNITKGTSAVTFSPDRTCTRAEIVTFLWRDAGSPMPTISRSPFSDVNYSMGADFYNAILWASQNGITAGTDVSHFSPNKTCTRAEIVTFLWRYAKKPVGYGSNSFTDVNKTDHAPYYDAILWAVSKGITNGSTTTTFAPDGTCTRGQAVTFLYRYEGGK
jgi:S-layer homology domain-containing protein